MYECCGPDTNLATAARLLSGSACGALLVLNVESQVLGMITDRNICMAAATKKKPPSEITVWETTSGKACTCRPSKVRTTPTVSYDDVVHTMKAISAHRVLVGISRRAES